MKISRNVVCLISIFAAIVVGFFLSKHFLFNHYDRVVVTERLEQKAFDTLCVERYPVEMEIYKLNMELSEELDKDGLYNGMLSGMIIGIKKDIENYEKNCK